MVIRQLVIIIIGIEERQSLIKPISNIIIHIGISLSLNDNKFDALTISEGNRSVYFGANPKPSKQTVK